MADDGGLGMVRWLVKVRVMSLGHRCEEVAPDLVVVVGADGERQEVPLEPLRRAATALPQDEWMAAVNQFVDRMFAPEEPESESLEAIRPLLRTKLLPEKDAEPQSVVSSEFGQDLVEGLVVDRALTMEWVTEDRALDWAADESELLRQGRENVRAEGLLEVDTVDVNGTTVTVLSGNDYASTHLYWLDEYGLVGEHGTLVSVPTPTMVLAVPIVAGANGLVLLDPIVRLTASILEDADKRLMPRIYHWDADIMEAMDQVLGAALLQPTEDGLAVIVNPAFQESQEALDD